LPYKARLLSDEDENRFWGGVSRELADLVAAARTGQRKEWIARHFLAGYPRDVPDEGLISDFLIGYAIRFMRSMYQCTQCGRLLLEERTDANRFRFFVPESVDSTPYRQHTDQMQPNILNAREEAK
jgi:hypothetical protein